MEEKLYSILRENININNIYFLDNKDNLICKNCNNLNIKSKICKSCNKSLCFFCQKNHRCHGTLELDNLTRELIKNITIICPNCKREIIYIDAITHIQVCLGNNSNSNIMPSAFNVPIADSRDKFQISIKNINNIPVEEKTNYLCCLDALLIISTLKIILGIIYSSIIIENLPPEDQYVDGNSKKGEKDKMKSTSNSDDTLATAHIVLCLIFLIAGYVFYIIARCINKYKYHFYLIAIPSIHFFDIIFGDLAIPINISTHRKLMKNNLNSYSRQELIHSLLDAYNEIYIAQWPILSIKIVLLIIAFIISFVVLSNYKKLIEDIEKGLYN